MIFEKIGDFAGHKCGLDKNRVIVAGVSGGPDSLCMLDALHRAGFTLLVAHFNHQLRAEAESDAEYVEKLALELGLPFVMGSAPVHKIADQQNLSLEEAARMLRYRFLFDQARHVLAQAVVTGHTADDQVETVLMNLIRGAGLTGLKGMQPRTVTHGWDAKIALARPLLATWREETEAYCVQRGLIPRNDITNQDQAYRRNRIRHELIPLLETYNPRIRDAIYRTATVLNGDFDALVETLDGIWETSVIDQGADFVRLSCEKMEGRGPGLVRGIIRKGIIVLKGEFHDFDHDTIEDAMEFINFPSRSMRKSLSNGLWIRKEDDSLYLYEQDASLPTQQWPQIDSKMELTFVTPGRIVLAGGWIIETTFVEDHDRSAAIQDASDNLDGYQAWLDYDQLKIPLLLRTRRKGDRWQPLGLKEGSQKLSDFFINARCPTRARDGWPLICSDNIIAWIPGYRPAQPFRLRDETGKILHICLKRAKSE